MLFRETLVVSVTRKLEFPPQSPILDHNQRVLTRHHEELRPDPELLERDLGHHREPASRGVPLPQRPVLGYDLDEALVLEANPAVLSRLGGGLSQIEGGGGDERAVHVLERVQRDAVLREHGEERVGRIVDDGGGEQTASSGDERRRAAVGFLRRNEAEFEDGALRAGDVDGRIGVNIHVVEVFGRGIFEKLLPERGEVEVGVCEEEEGDLEFGVFGGEVRECVGGAGERGGAVEEGEVVELVGERDWDGRVTWREETRG